MGKINSDSFEILDVYLYFYMFMNKLTNFISAVALTAHKHGQEELPHLQGEGRWPGGAATQLR